MIDRITNGSPSSNLYTDVVNKFKIIAEFFTQNYKADLDQQFIGLLTGRAGSIVLHSLLYESTKDPIYIREINDGCEYILNHLNDSTEISVAYASGLAGIGWTFIYLKDNNFIDFHVEEILEEIDFILHRELNQFLAKKEYDILYNALGIGMYFVKRKDIEEVERIVRHLYRAMDISDNEFRYSRFDHNESKVFIYDFGLAHGMAGALHFLGKAFNLGAESELSKKLIEGLFAFYCHNMQDAQKVGSYFPGIIPVSKYQSGTNLSQLSRVAWCYGDLGIAHSLYMASLCLNNTQMQSLSLEILLFAAQKREFKSVMVSDPGFCHGSSGNAIMFLNLYHLTSKAEFQEAAEHYISLTNRYGNKCNDPIESYITLKERLGSLQSTALLTGIGGPLLAFLYYLDRNINTDWKEIFFLK